MEKSAEAIYHLQKTMAILPEDLGVKIELGLALNQNNQPDLAVDLLLPCREKYPDDYRPYMGLAKAYSATGNFEQAAISH